MDNIDLDSAFQQGIDGGKHPQGQAKPIQTPSGSVDYDKAFHQGVSKAPRTGDSQYTDNASLNAGMDLKKYPFQTRAGADNDLLRADNQSWGAKAVGAIVGGVGKGLLDVGENVSYLLDPTDTINAMSGLDTLTDNGLAQLAEQGKKAIDDALPIYKRDNNPLGTDSGNVFTLLQGVIDSAVGFAIPGAGVAKVVEGAVDGINSLSLATRLLKYAGGAAKDTQELVKVLEGTEELGKGLQTAEDIAASKTGLMTRDASKGLFDNAPTYEMQTVPGRPNIDTWKGKTAAKIAEYLKGGQLQEAAHAIGTGLLSNHMEGKLMGLQSYNNVKQKLQKDVDEGTISPEAVEKAAVQAGNDVMKYNMMFLASDIYGLRALFSVKQAAREGIMDTFKGMAKKGLSVEAGAAAEAVARTRGIGGIAKEMFGSAGNEAFEEMAQNVVQSEAENNGLKTVGKDDKSQPKDALSRWWAMGTTPDSISQGIMGALGGPIQFAMTHGVGAITGDNKAHREALDHQANVLDQNLETIHNNMNSLAQSVQVKADTALDSDTSMHGLANDRAFHKLATTNLENGTVTHLHRLLDDAVALSPEEAKEKGYDEDYKQQALDLKSSLDKMEKSWVANSVYANHGELFNLDQSARLTEQAIKVAEEKLGPKIREDHQTAYDNFRNNTPEGKKVAEMMKEKGFEMPQSHETATSEAYIESLPEDVRKAYDKIVPGIKNLGQTDEYNAKLKAKKDQLTAIKAEIIEKKKPEYQEEYKKRAAAAFDELQRIKRETADAEKRAKAKEKVHKKKGEAPVATTESAEGEGSETEAEVHQRPTEDTEGEGTETALPDGPEHATHDPEEQGTEEPVTPPTPEQQTNQPNTPVHQAVAALQGIAGMVMNQIDAKRTTDKGKKLTHKNLTRDEVANAMPPTATKAEIDAVHQQIKDHLKENVSKKTGQKPEIMVPNTPVHPDQPEEFAGNIGEDLVVPDANDTEQGTTAAEQEAAEDIGVFEPESNEELERRTDELAGETNAAEAGYNQTIQEASEQAAENLAKDLEATNNKEKFTGSQVKYNQRQWIEGIDAEDLNAEYNDNADLNKYKVGTVLTAEPEPDNKFSKQAIALKDEEGRTVGYIAEDDKATRLRFKVAQDNGKKFRVEMTSVGQGKLYRSATSDFLSKHLPDPDLKIGVFDGQAMRVGTEAFPTSQMQGTTDNMIKGATYAMIPAGLDASGKTLHIAAPIQNSKLGDRKSVHNSLMIAADIWAVKEGTELTPDQKAFQEAVFKATGKNIRTTDGLRSYFELFTYNHNPGSKAEAAAKAKNKDNPESNVVFAALKRINAAETTSMLSIGGNNIRFGQGGFDATRARAFDVSKETYPQFRSEFAQIMKGMYFHVNDKLSGKENFTLPIIGKDGLSDLNKGGTYNDFIKKITHTNLKSYPTSNGSYAYTINRVMRYKVKEEAQVDPVEEATKERNEVIASLSPNAARVQKAGVHTIEAIKKELKVGHDKAKAVLQELVDKGLVERVQGDTVHHDVHVPTPTPEELAKQQKIQDALTQLDEEDYMPFGSEVDPVQEAANQLQIQGLPYEVHRDVVESIAADLWQKTMALKDKRAAAKVEGTEGDFRNLDSSKEFAAWKEKIEDRQAIFQNARADLKDGDPRIAKLEKWLGYYDTILNNWGKVKSFTLKELNQTAGLTIDANDETHALKENETAVVSNQTVQDEHNPEKVDNENSDSDAQGMKAVFDDAARLLEDMKMGVSARMRATLGYVPVSSIVDGKVKVEKNFLGEAKMIGFDQSYNEVVNALSGSKPIFENQLASLKEWAANKPYFNDLAAKLENADIQIKYEFASAFNKHYLNMQMVMHKTDLKTGTTNTYIVDSDSAQIEKMITADWQAGVALSGLFTPTEDGSRMEITPEKKAQVMADFNSLQVQYHESGPTEEFQQNVGVWLKGLGVDLHPGAISQLFSKGLKIGRATVVAKEMMDSSEKSKSPLAELYNRVALRTDADLEENPLIAGTSLKALASLQGLYSPLMMSSSGSSGGKTVYMHHFGRYMTDRVQELKTNEDLLKRLATTPYSAESTWLKQMIMTDKKGNPIDADGKPLAQGDKVVIRNNSEFFAKFGYGYVPLQALKAEGTKDDENMSLRDLSPLEHEMMKLAQIYSDEQDKNDSTRFSTFMYFTMSDKSTAFTVRAPMMNFTINSDGTLDENSINSLYKLMVVSEMNRITQASGVSSKIAGYKDGRLKFMHFPELNDLDIWDDKEKGILKSGANDILKPAFEQLLGKIVDDKVADWKNLGVIDEAGKLRYINADSVKAQEQRVLEPKMLARHMATDYALNYMANHINQSMLFSGDPAQYYKANKDGSKTNFEESFDNMGKRLAADMAQRQKMASLTEAQFNEQYLQLHMNDIEIPSRNIEQIRERFKDQPAIIKAYEEITSTDAQEYTTLDEFLDNMMRIGKMGQLKADRIRERDKDAKLTARDLKDINNIVLNATKPVHTGNQMDKEGVDRRVYIKSSAFPLTRTLTKGLELDNLRQFMEDSGIKRAVYSSGWKVGRPAKGMDIHNPDGGIKSLEDLKAGYNKQDHSLLLDRKNFGFQQDLPFDPEKDSINRVTQAARMLWMDQSTVSGYEFEGRSDWTSQDLKKEYDDSYGEMFKLAKEQLFEKLGVDENGKPDPIKVQKMLEEEANSRGYSLNDKASTAMHESGQHTLPIWATQSGSKLEAVLQSLISKQIIAKKMPGGSAVLASEAGFRQTHIDTTIDYIDEGARHGLKPQRTEDGVVRGAQILLPARYKEILMGKADKLSPEIMRLVGMRIPNQGLNSMADIEIAGFLPESVGDLVVGPMDWTKQMGSDFDVDKLYFYQYHQSIHTAEDGTRTVIRYNGDDKMKLLQNRIVDIHRAVLSNPANIKAVTSPLDDGELKQLSVKMDKLTGGEAKWNSMTDMYQRMKFINAGMGKVGIAVFSSDATFAAQAQGKGLQITIPETRISKDGKPYIVFVPLRMTFGNDISDGSLFNEKTISGKGWISDNYKAYQNAAVDNEKDPILAKLNINDDTMPAITAMVGLGFSKRTITAFLNQPIVRTWVTETVKTNSTLNADKGGRSANEAAVQAALDKAFPIKGEVNSKLANLGSQEMEDIIAKPLPSPAFNETQQAILAKFKQVLAIGANIKEAQRLCNTESQGLKPGMLESVLKGDKIPEMNAISGNGIRLEGAGAILGSFRGIDTNTKASDLINQGYHPIGDLFFKPTTYAGHATAHGLFAGNEMWQKSELLPYKSHTFNAILSNVKELVGRPDMSSAEELKLATQSFAAFKSYLYARPSNGFGENVTDVRRQLFFDNAELGLKSLASQLFDLKKEPWFDKNTFLSKLTFHPDPTGRRPSLIKYAPGSGAGFEEERIYGGFLDLANNPKPISEGRTTADLAKDLAAYSYLAGGSQGFTDFIKFVPVAILEKLGFNNQMRTFDWGFNSEIDTKGFAKQFIQHNVNFATPIGESPYKILENGKLMLTAEEGIVAPDLGKYLRVGYDGKSYFNTDTNSYITPRAKLYEKGKDGLYTPVARLGSAFFQEYQVLGTEESATSLIAGNNVAAIATPNELVARPEPKGQAVSQEHSLPLEGLQKQISHQFVNVRGEQGLRNVLDLIQNHKEVNPYFKELAREYQKLEIPANLQLVLENRSFYNTSKGILGLDLNKDHSVNELAQTILHEVGHLGTVAALDKGSPEAQAVKDLHAKLKGLVEGGYSKEAIQDFKESADDYKNSKEVVRPDMLTSLLNKGYTKDQANSMMRDLYGVSNVKEFITMSLTDANFQKTLNNIMIDDKGTSFWEKLKSLLSDLLQKTFGLEFKKGSALEYALKTSMDLIKTSQVEEEIAAHDTGEYGSSTSDEYGDVGYGEDTGDFDDNPFGSHKITAESVIKRLQDLGIVSKRKFTGEYWIKQDFAKGVNLQNQTIQAQNLAAISTINNQYGGKLLDVVKVGKAYRVRVNDQAVKEVNQDRGIDPGNKRDLGKEVSEFKADLPKAQRTIFDELREQGRLETKC